MMIEPKWVVAITSTVLSIGVLWFFRRRLDSLGRSASDYPIYLVKDENWSESGRGFEEAEWNALKLKYGSLEGIKFEKGKIFISNMKSEDISKLLTIAKQEQWLVEGWDGEIYE